MTLLTQLDYALKDLEQENATYQRAMGREKEKGWATGATLLAEIHQLPKNPIQWELAEEMVADASFHTSINSYTFTF